MLVYSTSWGMEPQMSTHWLFSCALRLSHCAVHAWKTRTERTVRTVLNIELAIAQANGSPTLNL